MATRLLLADDSITIHKVVSLTFAAEDVLIESVTNGHLAVEKARAGRPDIVLADVSMPGLNGYEVCAAIKSDPELASTPVVLLVGAFEPFDEREASRLKCDAYLTKPFDTSELIQIVRKLVKQHRSAQASVESSIPRVQPQVVSAVVGGATLDMPAVGLISERTRKSFLGANRILELFDLPATEPERASELTAPAGRPAEEEVREQPQSPAPAVIPFPGTTEIGPSDPSPITLTEKTIDRIVERVVNRMSREIVREIAWEVVPQLSEIMIRQYLDELRSARKS
ncbi:MAG: response regulator [Acidobacteriota bacterium]|jgi:CheY-like chemotaxis protein